MKTIKQQKLLAAVLSSDILYFTTNIIKKNNSRFLSSQIKLKTSHQYTLLNIEFFLQSIKQIIRLLQYNVKYYKNFLQLIVSNVLYQEIIEYISKTYNNNSITVNTKFKSTLNTKMVAYIDSERTQDSQAILFKIFNKNNNFILLINSYFTKNILGNYKLFADINNYKKLIFLILIFLLAQTAVIKKN